ncbi:MAG: basic amino acid ABC transporter substrate-binding protein [Marvinbryantia sp.]|jgi:ABC-type amino acid transport substrate-binding protein
MKKLIAAALTGAMAAAFCVPAMAEDGKLVMATNATFPPYEYYDADKQIVGIDAEVAGLIADKLGLELEIADMEFDSIIAAVKQGKADIGMAGITITEERKKNVAFTDTYTTATQMIIVQEGSPIASPDDLKDVKVGVQTGTTGDLYVSDLSEDGVEVMQFSKGIDAVIALSQGKVDAVVIDGEPAKVFVEENEGLVLLDEAFTEEEYAIAVAPDNEELLEQINTALDELEESGELQAVIDKYISGDSAEEETEAATEAAEEETTEAATEAE